MADRDRRLAAGKRLCPELDTQASPSPRKAPRHPTAGRAVFAVANGRTTGVLTSREELKRSVYGFAGASAREFGSREIAESWLEGEAARKRPGNIAPGARGPGFMLWQQRRAEGAGVACGGIQAGDDGIRVDDILLS